MLSEEWRKERILNLALDIGESVACDLADAACADLVRRTSIFSIFGPSSDDN